jgi:hypothetical protein
VEPRELNPLPPLCKGGNIDLPEVSGVCKIPAKACISFMTPFPSVQVIYSGCCTVAAPNDAALDFCKSDVLRRSSKSFEKYLIWAMRLLQMLASVVALAIWRAGDSCLGEEEKR